MAEEEFSELQQLLEDIQAYRRDIRELKSKDMEIKKKKEIDDKKGEEMRQAAMEGMASELCLQIFTHIKYNYVEYFII